MDTLKKNQKYTPPYRHTSGLILEEIWQNKTQSVLHCQCEPRAETNDRIRVGKEVYTPLLMLINGPILPLNRQTLPTQGGG